MYRLLDPKLINPKTGKSFDVYTPFKKFMQNNFEVPPPDTFEKFNFEKY